MLIYLQMLPNEEQRSRFEALYLRYRLLMFRVARRVLSNDSDAEDAVHQAFLRLIGLMDKLEDSGDKQTASFLAILAERSALDLLRKQRRNAADSLDELEEPGKPQRELEQLPLRLDFAAALAALPARYREVLLLKYDNGFTAKEISEILSMSEANVWKTLQRAKTALREKLGEEASK